MQVHNFDYNSDDKNNKELEEQKLIVQESSKVGLNSEQKLSLAKQIIFFIGAIAIGFVIYRTWPISSELTGGSKIAYNLLYIGISCGIAAILVTDFCIRFFLSVIISAIITLIIVGFAKLLHLTPTSLWWTGIIAGVLCLSGAYVVLSESSWIGHLCPKCSQRGKITKRTVDKEFLFIERRRTSIGVRPFAVYTVTHEKTCGSCSASWTWQTQESEQRRVD